MPNIPQQGQGQETSALNSPCLSRGAGTRPGRGRVLEQPRARGRVQNPREPVTGGAQAEGQTASVWSAGEVGQEHLPWGRRKHVTWALKDRSGVNRTF